MRIKNDDTYKSVDFDNSAIEIESNDTVHAIYAYTGGRKVLMGEFPTIHKAAAVFYDIHVAHALGHDVFKMPKVKIENKGE